MVNSYEVASVHEFHGQPHRQQSSARRPPGNGPFFRTKQAQGATHAPVSLPNPLYSALASATLFDTGAGRNTDPCAAQLSARKIPQAAQHTALTRTNLSPGACNTEYDQLSVSELSPSDRRQTTTRQLTHHVPNCQDKTAHLQLPFRDSLATAELLLRPGIISFPYPFSLYIRPPSHHLTVHLHCTLHHLTSQPTNCPPRP